MSSNILNEYFSTAFVEKKYSEAQENSAISYNSHSPGTTLRPTVASRSNEGDTVEPLSTPSPNWGFYVSITPPQQEVYALHTSNSISKPLVSQGRRGN